ncbi:hypothetical protein PR048_004224 [Dryococelus australis]|uniref:Uncharacterized protein n=1 Tax=Dryococelus australis TaxID=614101 RepID=A0ABQ9I4Z6_9NEOP|nr:hypothetical protein PR048_004224 [Dryococelus australis]
MLNPHMPPEDLHDTVVLTLTDGLGPAWKVWRRRRFVLVFIVFFGQIIKVILRVNLSIAIVVMTEEHPVITSNGAEVHVSTTLPVKDTIFNEQGEVNPRSWCWLMCRTSECNGMAVPAAQVFTCAEYANMVFAYGEAQGSDAVMAGSYCEHKIERCQPNHVFRHLHEIGSVQVKRANAGAQGFAVDVLEQVADQPSTSTRRVANTLDFSNWSVRIGLHEQ